MCYVHKHTNGANMIVFIFFLRSFLFIYGSFLYVPYIIIPCEFS